jgi:hypothetical protein
MMKPNNYHEKLIINIDAKTKARLDELTTQGYTIAGLVRKFVAKGLQEMQAK